MANAAQLIEKLKLEPHQEGGYFRRIFQADHRPRINTKDGERFSMTSIHYMLTADHPIGNFHKNKSDIMHVFNGGEPLTYYLIHPDGKLETKTLGSDLFNNQEIQFVCKGGTWKATELQLRENADHDYGLLTEVVVPGFDYADSELANAQQLERLFPQHKELIRRLSFS